MRRKTLPSFNHELTFGTARRRRGRWLFLLLVPLASAGLTLVMSKELRLWLMPEPPPAPTLATTPEPAPEISVIVQPEPPPPVRKTEIEYLVRPKDSLGQIFTQLKLDVTELPAILTLPTVRERFRSIQPDERLTFYLENGVLHGIRRRISETEVLQIARTANGFGAKIIETPIDTKTVQVRGTVNASLFAGGAAGLTPEMRRALADEIFGWDIDFALDPRPGDRFALVYEQRYRAGEYLGDGRIVAAEYVNDGETFRAVRYTSPDGKIDGYFTPDARSLRRALLRTPIDFTRAHPVPASEGPERVLSTATGHAGIDYPAPVGTAVKATADGRIRFLGMDGEYGNTVVIDHGASVVTLYAHLSAFARDLRANMPVRQGDIIGFVGYSGAATAPHLHYEYRVNGTYADPRGADIPPGEKLPVEYLPDFRSKSAALLASLERPADTVITALLN